MRAATRRLIPILAGAGLLLLAACGGEAPPSRPNVLLVTVDTLRPDRLSAYGYARPTSPFLDEVAASGVRFDRAYASSSWTTPSLVSLLTSLSPVVHGVEHGYLSNQVITGQEVIPESIAFLPELLHAAGYRTFGATANTHLYGRFGFDRGFDRYRCVGFLTAAEVLAVVDEWRDEIGSSEPWFLWVHLLDPHAGFTPHVPWIQQFFPGWRRLWNPMRGVLIPEDYKKAGVTPGSRRFDLVGALYDSEIAYTDDAIRQLAERVGVSDRDLVVVTADHGEEFLEHDHFGHGKTLYEEVLRVPLILRLPGGRRAGRVVSEPVRLLDVTPTVLEIAGVARPPDLQGESLLPLIEGTESTPREVSASLDRFPALGADAIIRGRWKYVQPRPEPDRRMLFDLESDPGERTNRIDGDPAEADALARALADRLASDRARRMAPGLAELTDDEFEQLKALGYIPR